MLKNTKSEKKKIPTADLYKVLQYIFDELNKGLFDSELPNAVIILHREKNVMGHYSYERWLTASGELVDEISMNPSYWADKPLINLFQTMTHEMCHLWQKHHGESSRSGYHNKEWAKKMVSIGLMPSHNGLPGGRITGQKMSDYPVEDGKFLKVAERLSKSSLFRLFSVDRLPTDSPACQYRDKPNNEIDYQEDSTLFQPVNKIFKDAIWETETKSKAQQRKAKRKVTYECEKCDVKVWGKSGLSLMCCDCDCRLLSNEI